jgi:hypothetical protein
MKDTERHLSRLHQDMIRLNTMISKNQELSAALEDNTFNLQRSVVCELKELEGKAAKLERDIDEAAQSKKRALSDVLETERQIMLWERKIQLEREMQDILDPSAGQVCWPEDWHTFHAGKASPATTTVAEMPVRFISVMSSLRKQKVAASIIG